MTTPPKPEDAKPDPADGSEILADPIDPEEAIENIKEEGEPFGGNFA